MVHLHWKDLEGSTFALGPEHPVLPNGQPVLSEPELDGDGNPILPHFAQPVPGPWPGERRAAFESVEEALEQAAHDVAFDGAVVARILDESGKDVLDRGKLVKRAHALIDAYHEPLRDALPEREFKARVAAVKADVKRRVG